MAMVSMKTLCHTRVTVPSQIYYVSIASSHRARMALFKMWKEVVNVYRVKPITLWRRHPCIHSFCRNIIFRSIADQITWGRLTHVIGFIKEYWQSKVP